jgi:ketosteroid isomerase-like protein
MSNKELIEKFYSAFQNKDSEIMASCYHPEVVFKDPAFGTLKGDRAKAMWKMLCNSSKDLKIEFSEVSADENKGSAHWEADYTFSRIGNKVHNNIDATFVFKDGLIITHTDDFNLRKWAGQAIGFKGKILGGTAFFKKKLQAQTNSMLDRFIKESK